MEIILIYVDYVFLCRIIAFVLFISKVCLFSLVVCLQDDPLGNLNLAFDIAEKHLDIPKMLDAEGKR